jgi:LuxR family maltose regulon positive regulatory protein
MIRARHAGAVDEVATIAREVLIAHDSGTSVGSVEQEAVAVTLSYMGGAELSAGDLDAAEAHLLRAQTLTVRAGLEPHRLECLSQLALLHVLRGQLNDADRLGRVAVQFAESLGWSSTALATGGHLALAWVHYERDELALADGCLAQASIASHESPGNPLAVFVKVLQARLRHAQGDLVGAFQALDVGAGPDTDESSEPRSPWLVATEADIRIAIGDLSTAHDLLDMREGGDASVARAIVRRARLAVAEGDPHDAATALALVGVRSVPSVAADVLLEARLVEGLAYEALGDSDRAVACLQRAVDLAEPQDARRAFLDAAPALRPILSHQGHRIASSWSLLDDLASDPVTTAHVAMSGLPVMIEPLTERERGVLRFLPSMLSYGEIAAELYISPHTIKSHARSIYRKLGSNSRRDAVERARGLRLLRS